MTPATAQRRADPFRYDALIAYAGGAAERAAPKDKQYASALGISRSRATCHRNGDENSATAKVLLTFTALATHEHTSAIPLLAEAWGIVMAAEIEKLDNDALDALHEQLTDQEHDDEATESRATARLREDSPADAFDEAAAADMREAETQIRRARVRREIAVRMRKGEWK